MNRTEYNHRTRRTAANGLKGVFASVLLMGSIVCSAQDGNVAAGDADTLNLVFKTVTEKLAPGSVSSIDIPQIVKKDNYSGVSTLISSYGAGLLSGLNLYGVGDVLVLIDGQPRDIDNLQPEEIESVTLLKDVNSTVLYGSQAKNGILSIVTKRGKVSEKDIRFGVETGVQVPIRLPQYLGSREYMTLYNEAFLNDSPSSRPPFRPSEIAKYDGSNPYRYPDVDYYSSDFLKPMTNSTRVLGEFTSGNDVARFYANVGWENHDKLYKVDDYSTAYNRFKIRSNIDFNITPSLKSFVDAFFVFDLDQNPRTDYFTLASTLRPNDYTPLLSVDLFEDPSLLEGVDIIDGKGIMGGHTVSGKNSYGKNIYGELNRSGYQRDYRRTMQFDIGLVYDLSKITKGLSVRGTMNIDTYGGYSEAIENTYALYEPVWSDATGKIFKINRINQDTKTGVMTLKSGTFSRGIGANISADYKRTFGGKHSVSASVLGFYSYRSVESSAYSDRNSHIGFNAAYSYDNKFLVDFSGALIHSLKLAPGHKNAFSPTLGLSWIPVGSTRQNDFGWINFLKLKASAGILHTDTNLGYNLWKYTYWGSGFFGTGDNDGYSFEARQAVEGNYNLGMEKMKKLNVGLETRLAANSLSLNANFFYVIHDDLVMQRKSYYPQMLASRIPYENYGRNDYTGMDLSVGYVKNFGEVKFSSMLNLLYATSKVVRTDEAYKNDYQNRTGKALDTFWGLRSRGFFRTDEQAEASNQLFGSVKKGDIRYADKDGDGYVNDDDVIALGNYNPRWVGTLNMSAEWRGLTLFVSASTRLKYNWVMSGDYFRVNGDMKYSEIVRGRWTEATADTATYPRLSAQSNENNFRDSDFWMRDGNCFSLDRLQLSYLLPSSLFAGSIVKDIRVYLRGDNLWFISEDAKYRQTGYWNTRNVALGLNISF